MRFALGAEQRAFRDAARALLLRLCPPSAVRAAWDGRPDQRAWRALADMGALGVLAPEADGGLGLDETYLAPVICEAGAVALPHPLAATALVAAPLGVTARPGPDGRPGEQRLRATTDLGGSLAPYAATADVFLLAVGGELRLYERPETAIEPVETVDRSRQCARVSPAAAGTLVTADEGEIEAAFCRGALGAAAELVGLSRTMLELTVAYVKQRRQFGKPVGSFQAVKHQLAEARLQLEFAEPSVGHAAYSMARGLPDAARSVSQAKWLAGAAAAVTGRAALQCHGAIGYTVESDLHLYLKRSWALARSWGGADFHADRVAAAVGL